MNLTDQNPTIVVVTYNRINSLKRILQSISQGIFEDFNIHLIISIDGGSVNNYEIVKTADEFDWHFGEKHVIKHNENIGLRNHIISCGDLVYTYGTIIILEDDLYVSPYFYRYALEASRFYGKTPEIGGIALYSYQINVNVNLPFHPLEDEHDTYFMQFPASWGQCWTRSQWDEFKKWYSTNPQIFASDRIPSSVKAWPETSWLKYFTKYLMETNKYFVYPYSGYSTNFSDPGEHNKRTNTNYQTNLRIGYKKPFFREFSKSNSTKYDSYFELKPESLVSLVNYFEKFDFEIDLYGSKQIELFDSKYWLSSKFTNRAILSFPLELRPVELNIIYPIITRSKGLYFAERESFSTVKTRYKLFEYYSFRIEFRYLTRYYFSRITNILMKYISQD